MADYNTTQKTRFEEAMRLFRVSDEDAAWCWKAVTTLNMNLEQGVTVIVAAMGLLKTLSRDLPADARREVMGAVADDVAALRDLVTRVEASAVATEKAHAAKAAAAVAKLIEDAGDKWAQSVINSVDNRNRILDKAATRTIAGALLGVLLVVLCVGGGVGYAVGRSTATATTTEAAAVVARGDGAWWVTLARNNDLSTLLSTWCAGKAPGLTRDAAGRRYCAMPMAMDAPGAIRPGDAAQASSGPLGWLADAWAAIQLAGLGVVVPVLLAGFLLGSFLRKLVRRFVNSAFVRWALDVRPGE